MSARILRPSRPVSFSSEFGPTNREIRELDALLLADDGLENPMDFYAFEGFRPKFTTESAKTLF
jgi:hypothetical protein